MIMMAPDAEWKKLGSQPMKDIHIGEGRADSKAKQKAGHLDRCVT